MKPKILLGAISILTLMTSAAFTPSIPEGPAPDHSTIPNSVFDEHMPQGAFLATIYPVEGEVFWRQEDEQSWFTIDNQQGLDTGNQVLTKTEGRARIEYYDGIIVRIGPHTLFTVTEQTQTEELNLISRIRLLMGQIFIKHGEGYYQGKFEVETPTGVAAVKGTMMSVQITTDGQTLVTCLEGVCSLSNDLGELVLTEGQGASIQSEDEAPQPAEIEDWQLNDWFENDPDTVSTALHQGLIDHIPDSCNAATGKDCLPASFYCDVITGHGCQRDNVCDPISGKGCSFLAETFVPLDCAQTGTCLEVIDTSSVVEVINNPIVDNILPVIPILPDEPLTDPQPIFNWPIDPIIPDFIFDGRDCPFLGGLHDHMND